MMTIPEIFKELEPYTGRFPMQALKAAIEQREAITPGLLRLVEAIAANPADVAKRKDYRFSRILLKLFNPKASIR